MFTLLFYILFGISLIFQNDDNDFLSLHCHTQLVIKRIKYFHQRITYYSNSCSTFNVGLCKLENHTFNFILFSGDVELNPGPNFKHPCGNCEKPVKSNQQGLLCKSCDKWFHTKCQGISKIEYSRLYHTPLEVWVCLTCSLPPFCDSIFLQNLNVVSDSNSFNTFLTNETGTSIDIHNDVYDESPENLFATIFDKKGLHFIHLNVRSLLSKMSEFRLLFSEKKISIIALTETWLNDSINDEEIYIDGYSIIRKDRDTYGGGVCLYIKNEIAYSVREDLIETDTESVWIHVLLPKTKPIIVGVLYRPPKQKQFIEKFSTILEKLNGEEEIIILGDINVCTLKYSVLSKRYNELLNLFDLKQLINEPTRTTASSSSLLDHVLCNTESKISQSGVIQMGLSDHSLIYCSRKVIKPVVGKHKFIEIRSLKKYSIEDFNQKLNNVDWTCLDNNSEVNQAWACFKDNFNIILNDVAPRKRIRVKQRTEKWMSAEILHLIRERNVIFKRMKKNIHNEQFVREYCKLRNLVQRRIRKAKSDFILNQIEENKDCPKKLWQHLKELGIKNKKGAEKEIVLNIDGMLCHDKSKIVNEFNRYFTEVAAGLADKLPICTDTFSTISNSFCELYKNKGVTENSFKLSPVTEKFVLEELFKLNARKSTGLDAISARFLKDGARQLSGPLAYIINLSITTSTFPDDMKIARVRPLFKKKDKTDVCNYRPISILSVVSKILEKAVLVQVEKYFIAHNVLYEFQSGFRHNFSTETCLIHLLDFIRTEISYGRYVGMVLLDLQKAFDTVNHDILLNKLHAMGFNDTCQKWFKSYLTHRYQIVSIDNVMSDLLEVKCGVPQGSILGPLLFMCYINDMCISIRECKLLLYADDSVLAFSHVNPKEIENKLSSELINCNQWLVDNKLSLHTGKTDSILFSTKRKGAKYKNFKVMCNNTEIIQRNTIKYLGITLNNDLSSNVFVDSLVKKANSRLRFLYRYKNCLNKKARRTLYFALIQCLFDYGIASWHNGLGITSKKKLKVTQNKAVRFIESLGPRAHVGYNELVSAGLLDVHQRAKQMILHYVHKIMYIYTDHYITQYFKCVTEIHDHDTRHRQLNFNLPQNFGIIGTCFYYNGIKYWNSLPGNLKSILSYQTFKIKLKQYLYDEIAKVEMT